MDTFLFIFFFVCVGYWLASQGYIGKKKQKIIIIKDDSTVHPWSAEDMAKISDAFEEINKELNNNVQIEDTVDEILKEMTSDEDISNATKALKKLGYNAKEITKVVVQVTSDKSVSLTSADIVTSALTVLNA